MPHAGVPGNPHAPVRFVTGCACGNSGPEIERPVNLETESRNNNNELEIKIQYRVRGLKPGCHVRCQNLKSVAKEASRLWPPIRQIAGPNICRRRRSTVPQTGSKLSPQISRPSGWRVRTLISPYRYQRNTYPPLGKPHAPGEYTRPSIPHSVLLARAQPRFQHPPPEHSQPSERSHGRVRSIRIPLSSPAPVAGRAPPTA